jgi:hypothetical protein
MSITVELSNEEIAQISSLTKRTDGAEAVAQAAREFVRICRLRELSAMSGQVDFELDWPQLEALELVEVDFPR